MKIKKLLVGFVASVLVVASVATTAFAAQSPSTDKTPTPTPKQAASSSSSSTKRPAINPDVLASNIAGDIIKYDGIDIDPTIPATLKKLSESTIASAKALGTGGILKAVDVEDSSNPNGKGTLYQESITVKFRSSVFKAGMKITVLHLPDGSSNWEKITPDSISDGECVVTFSSLSPVVFTAEGVSDKTGETAPILPIVAAIFLAGAVFFGAKYRFAK